jgi:assimilatory nitrate reductase electron transfer subunit
MTRLVVIGNGMAGARLVEELVARDMASELDITVYGAEPGPAYNRILLSNVLAGVQRPEDTLLLDRDWYDRNSVTLRTGARVTAVDREQRVVHAADGTSSAYDVLVFATGSSPVLPPLRGLVREGHELIPGAFAFRTLDDCAQILAAAADCRRAVVVGGGLLGLEAARGLQGQGLPVEVVHVAPHLMERQLDESAAGVLQSTMQRLGVSCYLGVGASAVLGTDRVTGLRLDDGYELECDLVVFACGVRPNVHVAAEAGLAVNRAIVVDDQLRSIDDPRIHALGECAEHRGQVYGLVAPAWEQASVLADVLTGARDCAAYTGSQLVTRLKAMGVDLAAIGDSLASEDDAEVIRFSDPVRGTYKKIVVRDGRIAGAILLGDVTTAATVMQAYDRGTVLPADRLYLMFDGFGGAPATDPSTLPDDAQICTCNQVSKGAIVECVRRGAATVGDIAAHTRATTGCGTCRGTVEQLLDHLGARDPVMRV